MRVGIPTLGCDSGKSGIGYYTVHLIREFARLRPDWEFIVPVYEDEQSIFIPDAPNVTPHIVGPRYKKPLPSLIWTQVLLPSLARQKALDVLFLPAANRRIPFYVPCVHLGTVHDYSSIHMEGKYDALRMFYITKVLPFLHRRLDHVVTVSEHSKNDITDFARVPENRVTIIYIGVDAEAYRPMDRGAAQAAMLERHGITSPYLLYLSRLEHPGKNHVRLIEAFEQFKAESGAPHKLVCAGSDWSNADVVHGAHRKCRVKEDIRFTGFFPGADIPQLYAGADGLVFPSLYEGFGLPLIEAMACECPVACSNVSSLPEVAGDAAILFDPYSPGEIAHALSRLALEPELRNELIAKGLKRSAFFRWEICFEATLQCIEATVRQVRH
ncbi:MAG: glycosyltransferase family 4 protein [Candidatus Hydrogenedentes bacterium]|nr:glycosyltransferase family 4 protein [Candidatus Hydrogenedentota bacterium]